MSEIIPRLTPSSTGIQLAADDSRIGLWGRALCRSDHGPVVAPGGDPCNPGRELPAQRKGASCCGVKSGVGRMSKRQKKAALLVGWGTTVPQTPPLGGTSRETAADDQEHWQK